jgi:hypothetical protein
MLRLVRRRDASLGSSSASVSRAATCSRGIKTVTSSASVAALEPINQ